MDISLRCHPPLSGEAPRRRLAAKYTEFVSRQRRWFVTMQLSLSENSGERLLVQAGQRGEPQALNTLFHRHRKLLFHSALGITGNHQDAEDALQDGLLCAFRSLQAFEGRAKFSTWLTRIVINAALTSGSRGVKVGRDRRLRRRTLGTSLWRKHRGSEMSARNSTSEARLPKKG